ncbi:hypothetical protein U9M48_007313, partial [Paspalum notatum var. saurae]
IIRAPPPVLPDLANAEKKNTSSHRLTPHTPPHTSAARRLLLSSPLATSPSAAAQEKSWAHRAAPPDPRGLDPGSAAPKPPPPPPPRRAQIRERWAAGSAAPTGTASPRAQLSIGLARSWAALLPVGVTCSCGAVHGAELRKDEMGSAHNVLKSCMVQLSPSFW